ncbi:hypothetical protein TRM7557_02783 [Tritonibacter multivorans]|uniref:DUF2147 domain-containing protein n=1 Tax=Tritonibacter multivorans TaxID=928856 RepID=A0A0P1GXK6_9RHOB|nr:DUF2147 domain-containing protein [Tritonibacter multivorans]MDA7421076.1 DUF2147 domain-containing protein [Tritonibacter multivorans]CUH80227.1 hypothetical protein TRM7557_02783 [Tritonibacter multivorans]SFC76121.1 Uncharacterized conserved protein, DUF2147 family [Tritonibacter multivorans]
MKRIIAAAAAAIAFGTVAAADPVAGTWQTEAGDTGGYLHVAIAPCGSDICGTISKAFDASGSSDGAYENLGKKLIWDMKSSGNGDYAGGKIWAPDSDKTYVSKMALNGNKLKVKGCVAGGLICRGQTWTRVK